MKRAILLMILCIGPVGWLATAQEEGEVVKPKSPITTITKEAAPPPPPARSPGRRFDLNFAGGTPKQLVDGISKQLDRSLNAIIPEEHRDVQLPPLKMANVTVDELFAALSAATQRTTQYLSGWQFAGPTGRMPQYNTARTSYGFRTSDKTPDENSIWYFYHEAPVGDPSGEPKEVLPACRYWNLSPYLETYKVEDITTAVETGWKMRGTPNPPKLSFHKDTKLLIGVGQASDLQTVDEVLRQLEPPRKNPVAGVTPGATAPVPPAPAVTRPTLTPPQ